MDGRRHELSRPEPPVLVGESSRETPAFRLHVMRSVRMRPVLAGSVAAVVFVLLVAYALARKPVYTAESLIYVEPLEVRVLTDGSSSGYDPSRYDSYLQQQVQTVERPDTLEAAVAKIPAGVWGPPGEPAASAARRLLNSMKVDRVLNSYELGIDITASSATAAAAGANAVAAAYLEAGRKDEHARADQRLQLLTEERQRITDDMTEDKAEQASLGRNLGVASPNGASGNPYDLQSEGLRSQLASAREAHDAVAAQLASVSGQNGNGLETAANEMILTDAGLVSQRQTLSQRRAVLSDQMAGLTPANPVYRQDQEEIAGIDRAMERATDDARQRAERQLQDKLRLDLGRTADVEGRLNAQLAQQTAKATGAGPKLQRAAELETDLQRLSTRFATVDDAIRGLQLETGGPGQAHLAMAARVPDSAQPSRSKLILLLALPLALLFGAGAAVAARKRDPKLYLAGDMQEVLGFPPMAVLPSSSEVSPEAYDEFVLRLAGGLEGAYRHGGARSFVFTPVSVSGRAAAMLPQLCKKLRQIGYRAVVVAADELMPGTAKTMESGTHEIGPVRAREGFATTKLERLLEEYDLVLVVAPPLLGSAVAEYTVRSADATILLVESTRTERGELRRAAMLLERLNPQGIGAVLEDLPLHYADPVFRAAVQAADSWPMMPVKRAAEKARVSSAVAVAAHKPVVPEIKLPSVATVLPVQEVVAENVKAVEAPVESPYVEEEAAEIAEASVPIPVPMKVEPPHVLRPEIIEHERHANVPAVSSPVPLPPVVAAAQSAAAVLMDEEPVAISTEFRPVRFHEASVPKQHVEIKYFTEQPPAGFEQEPVPLTEPVRLPALHEALVEEAADTLHEWEWARPQVAEAHERAAEAVVEEPVHETFFESFRQPVSESVSESVHGEPAVEESVYEHAGAFDSEAVIVPVAEAPECLAEGTREEEAIHEPIVLTSEETLVEREKPAEEVAEQTKSLSWFQRVFGAEEEPLQVTPEPMVSAAVSEAEVPMPSSEAVQAPLEHIEVVAEPAVQRSEPEHFFPETAEAAAEQIARVEPPIAFEESLWLRGASLAEAGSQHRVQFFLDLSPQATAQPVEAQETVLVPEAILAPLDEAHVEAANVADDDHELVAEQEKLPESLAAETAGVAVEESRGEFADEPVTELVREQMLESVVESVREPTLEPIRDADVSARDKRAVGMWPVLSEAVTSKVMEEVQPRHEVHAKAEEYIAPEIVAGPVEAVREETLAEALATEVEAEPHLVAMHAFEKEKPVAGSPLTPMHPEPEPFETPTGTSLAPTAKKDSPRLERHAVSERKSASLAPFAPSIAPISGGQFPLRTLERTGGQRAGLARAMRQAGIEDKSPVRSAEEHTPLRTASGLRKAVVRQEAVLRSHVQPAEPLGTQPRVQPGAQAGMSRRWGMLSRFERIGSASETGDLAGSASKNGTDSSQ